MPIILDRNAGKPLYGPTPPKEVTPEEYDELIQGGTVRGMTIDDGPFQPVLPPGSPELAEPDEVQT